MNKLEYEKKMKMNLDMIGTRLNNYEITKYIGSGSFGNVFEARNIKTNEKVALKIPVETKERNGQQSLFDESKIYKHISNTAEGVANMKIMKCKERHIIVMDLLGQSLEQLLITYKKLGIKTIIRLAISMLSTIKYIHSCGYIHRDLKPDNFAIGADINNSKLYCIDFGLAKKYVKKNGEHIDFKSDKKFCGTPKYASIAAHKHCEQSRKDDLESIGYILVYLFHNSLPWKNIKHKDKNERYRLICEKKEQTSEEELCKNMPREFLIFLKYVRNMEFNEKPPYNAFINMFKKLYESRDYPNDKFIWETKKII